MILEDGTKLKYCKGHSDHMCETLLPVFKSAPMRCCDCKPEHERKLYEGRVERRREQAAKTKVLLPTEVTPDVSEKVLAAVKLEWYNYEIRDQYGVSDEGIRKIVCSHYQRRAKIGEPA